MSNLPAAIEKINLPIYGMNSFLGLKGVELSNDSVVICEVKILGKTSQIFIHSTMVEWDVQSLLVHVSRQLMNELCRR